MICFHILVSTCYRKPYPEPARLSRANQNSGKAFTLDRLRARDIILTQVEASHPISTSFLSLATAFGFPNVAFQSAIRAATQFTYSFARSVLTNPIT